MVLADPTTEVLIIDNATVDRAGEQALLRGEADLKVCAKVESLEQALTLAVQPTVVILGLVSGGSSDLTAIEGIKARFPNARIVILAHMIELAVVRTALGAGVEGYVSKSAPSGVLVRAVRAVASGDRYLDPEVGVALATEHDQDRSVPVIGDLSPSETEVLRLIALGHTNAEIAELLANSLRTIETHRASIQRKLDVHTRAALVRVALDAGLVGP